MIFRRDALVYKCLGTIALNHILYSNNQGVANDCNNGSAPQGNSGSISVTGFSCMSESLLRHYLQHLDCDW